MFDFTTPAFRELFFDCIAPLDDRDDVGVVVRLHQCEALTVIEFTVNVERFDFEVEVIEQSEELCDDFGGGVAVWRVYKENIYQIKRRLGCLPESVICLLLSAFNSLGCIKFAAIVIIPPRQ